jgi:hypothetical protein
VRAVADSDDRERLAPLSLKSAGGRTIGLVSINASTRFREARVMNTDRKVTNPPAEPGAFNREPPKRLGGVANAAPVWAT